MQNRENSVFGHFASKKDYLKKIFIKAHMYMGYFASILVLFFFLETECLGAKAWAYLSLGLHKSKSILIQCHYLVFG